jgi:heat shock protein HslJ
MIPRFAALVIAWAILAYCPLSSAAQATQTQRISFAPGAYSATVQGSIAGDRIVDYKLGAKAGQTMSVTLKTDNPANYFNVLPPGSEAAVFIGSTSGNEWTGTLTAAGDQTVRVYLMRSAARQKEKADYTLTFSITSSAVGAARSGNESKAPGPGAGEKTAAPSPQKNPLAGTEWRLMEIQSMDDAVGTTRTHDPSQYTMRLNSDGTVAMRLNCNSAKGSWSAEAGPDPSSGHFSFGPLAATRALCRPPSLDEQIAAQAQYIRSYLLKDGRLYLSLMADGGIYAWEPLHKKSGEPFVTEPDLELEAAILLAEPDYTREAVDIAGGVGKGRYVHGRVDLNGDGRDEVFVYLLGSIFCGTGGCDLLLFTKAGGGYSLVNKFPISRLPIIVSAKRTKGWNDIMRLESGGGAKASYVRHTFDGKRYVKRERMLADKAPAGKSYLTGELSFDKGIPLEPRK